jgi:ribosomal protein S18 acetylase RimI-like enzyme
MKIETYKPDHLRAAVTIFRELSKFYLAGMASSEPEIEKNLVENILSGKSGVKLILALDENGKAIGLATVSILYPAPKEMGQLYLKELFVSSQCQGFGVGKKMMSFIANYAIKNGCSRLDWTTERDNVLAVEFYRSINAKALEEKIYYRAEGQYLLDLAGADY